MNKQELIEKYEYLNHAYFRRVDTSEVLRDLKQLDEPQKVVVSEEEAKFLKTFNFRRESDVTKALYYVSRTGFCYYLTDGFDTELKGLSEGFRDLENRKRLIKAILDGYEVEKEKRYKVVMLNIASSGGVLTRIKHDDSWIWIDTLGTIVEGRTHTRKELENAGFGWVFDCPGLEVEEVEE